MVSSAKDRRYPTHVTGAMAEATGSHWDALRAALGDAIRIGCRIRRSKFYDNPRYRSQFTIRSARPGNETELSKILAGWGDYIFYGFADDAGGLLGYMLGDLYKFRGWYAGQLQSGCSVGSIHVNGDGSSQFMAFCWAEIPGFVVATDGLRGDLSPCLATARAGR